MKKSTQSENLQTESDQDDIRAYAQHLFEQSGCAPGRDLDNWLEAEAYIRENLQRRQKFAAEQELAPSPSHPLLDVASTNPFRTKVTAKTGSRHR